MSIHAARTFESQRGVKQVPKNILERIVRQGRSLPIFKAETHCFVRQKGRGKKQPRPVTKCLRGAGGRWQVAGAGGRMQVGGAGGRMQVAGCRWEEQAFCVQPATCPLPPAPATCPLPLPPALPAPFTVASGPVCWRRRRRRARGD